MEYTTGQYLAMFYLGIIYGIGVGELFHYRLKIPMIPTGIFAVGPALFLGRYLIGG